MVVMMVIGLPHSEQNITRVNYLCSGLDHDHRAFLRDGPRLRIGCTPSGSCVPRCQQTAASQWIGYPLYVRKCFHGHNLRPGVLRLCSNPSAAAQVSLC